MLSIILTINYNFMSIIDLTSKNKFFAQYYGQKILHNNEIIGEREVKETHFTEDFVSDYLELKNPKNLSDVDAKELSLRLINVVGLDGFIREKSENLVREIIENYSKHYCLFMLPNNFADKIRELGYAFDWNDINIPKQIELGWIKLKS